MKRIPPPKGCKAMLVGLGKEWYCGDCNDLTWAADKNQPRGCNMRACPVCEDSACETKSAECGK